MRKIVAETVAHEMKSRDKQTNPKEEEEAAGKYLLSLVQAANEPSHEKKAKKNNTNNDSKTKGSISLQSILARISSTQSEA